ncbi:hypothetical protein [Komagataeibacter sp. FNDCF1]|uniref:hypothetical protein n=1 Tax=Komagataeibacter sp. FNDCF1 TaxID=2878681 RepID=UPI001E5F90B0|nr:hypothetical protein [Komagataeibacter sp. FNDCF1]MCE2563159.1 hypothetical protein [Komagataeibacter sp. FNDCF1]
MTRDVFIPRAGTPPTVSTLAPDTSTPAAPAQAPTGNGDAPPDPLAGAFPAWDLVPATQFVRRR